MVSKSESWYRVGDDGVTRNLGFFVIHRGGIDIIEVEADLFRTFLAQAGYTPRS